PFTSLTFGGGDLGGTVTDNAGGTSVALAGGTLTVNNNGTMTLNGATVPGTFTFDYQLTNANGVSNISTVTIEVRALPIAQPDALTAIVNIVNNFAAPTLFNDNGSGADTLGSPTATLVSFGGGSLGGAVTDNAAGTTVVAAFAGGDLTVNADGSLTVSNPTTTGVFTFDYRIQNVAGFSDATVTVTINQAPIAQDDAYTFLFNVDQNVAAGAGLFVDNGSGADNLGNPVATLTSFGGGDLGGAVTDNIAGASVALAGGTLTVNADGSWSLTGQPFTPSTFTFDYRLTNAFGTSDATVTLVIQDPPIAFDDTGYTVAVGNTLNVAAGAGVFVDNGFGADNLGTPTATLVSFGGGSMGGAVTDNAAGATVTGGLAGGDITVNADGSFTLANPTTAGTFTFQYRIQNISGFSDATVTIIITQAPDGFDDTDATVLGGTSSPGSNNFHLAVNTSSNGIVNVYVDNGFGADILGGPSAPTDPPADDINNVLLNGVPDPGTGTIGGGAFAIGGTGSIEITTAGDINITPPTNFVGLIEFDYILANSIGVDPTPATVTFAFGQRATCLDDPNYTATSNIEITINAAGGVLANDVGNGIVIEQLQGAAFTAPSTTAATTNGSVTLNADGSFTYEPNAGFVGMDTFTYTINNIFNTPQTCTATIDVTAPMGMIPWFIDNSAAGANLGTFNDPFTSIAAFNAVNNTGVTSPNDDDVIYIFRSTGYNEADGINLDDGQKLFGGGVQFDTVFTADANSSAAYQTFASTAAGANTLIESTGGNGIDLANTNIVEGINIGNTPAGAGINGNGFGTLTLGQVSTVNITGTGQIVNLVTGTLNSTFNSLTTTARPTGTDGIFMNGVSGNLTATTTSVSGGDQHGIQVINSPAGGGTFNFGNTTITTNGSGDNGILLNNNNAAQTIQTTNGTINSTGGEAINATNSNVNMALTNVTSTNSNDDGIDLDGVSGSLTITGLVTVDTPVGVLNSNGITIGTSSATVTINSVDIDNAPSNGVILDNNTGTIDINGGNIDGAALIGVSVLGGTANFSYSGNIGTIVPNTGPAVAIANVTGGAITFDTGTINSTTAVTAGIVSSLNTGGTTNFDGPVTLNTTGAALGVSISNNAGHTTSFTNNTLTITTNNATGFFATNAGTVNTTAGTISTGTGIGVDIDNTTLGMTLTSVTTNGAVNGINLDTTTGSFNVAGDGTMTQNDSGGVILNPTSHGVVLNNATNVTLQSMRIDGINTAGTHGISSTGGQNFVFKGLVVQNINGGLNVVRSSGWRGTDLGGVNQVVDSLFQNFGAAADAAIDLQNTTVGMTSLLIDNSTFQNQNDANGKSVVFIRSLGGINMGTVTVEDSLFTNLRGIGLQTAAEGTSTLVSVLQRNTFRDAVTTGLGGINGLVTSASNSGNHTITIDSNDFDDVQIAAGNAGSLVVTAFDTSTLNATINNNRFIDLDTDGNVVTDAQAIRVVSEQTGGGPVNVTISNNTLNNIGRQAIFISTRNQAPDVDINISNNIIGNLVPVGFTNRDAISISAEDDSNLDVLLTGNNVTSNTTTQEVLNIFTDRVTGGNTPVLNATIDNSSGTGNTFTNSNGGGADNVVIETLDVAETICVNMSGNTIAGVNTIDLTHSGGTFNVTQASEAAMEAANGGANVIPTGTVTFNQPACALPTIP
ncbi:MAG: S-layer family protein, partial [Chloroflexi bacterium]